MTGCFIGCALDKALQGHLYKFVGSKAERKMDINKFFKEELRPILSEYNFVVAEEYKNWIVFRSSNVKFSVSFNDLDRECLFMIGYNNHELYEVNDKIIKEIFESNLSLTSNSVTDFMNKLIAFMKAFGEKLLKGDELTFKKINEYWQSENHRYTSQIVNAPYLLEADIAWRSKNYEDFVDVIKRLDQQFLTPSLLLKYKIACKNIKQ